jgi:large subunit ribosomal protein L23
VSETTAKKKPVLSREKMYQTILSPLVTEKAAGLGEKSQVSFKVTLDATKPEIKASVEALFGVTVVSVNTLVVKGRPSGCAAVRACAPTGKRLSCVWPRARAST